MRAPLRSDHPTDDPGDPPAPRPADHRADARVFELVTVVVLGVLAVLELRERLDTIGSVSGWPIAIAVGMVVAAGLARRLPSVSLGLVWLVGMTQLWSNTPVLLIEASITVVAFGCARWGRVATVVASAISIPLASAAGVALVANFSYSPFADTATAHRLYDLALEAGGGRVVVVLAGVPLVLLAVPWFAGLAVRSGARARTSQASQVLAEEETARAVRATEQAQEIARLRDDQARLARDVHDVVGHSLAVILAQAESAQYLSDDDPARLKATMATIATSARASLQDVRHVLSRDDADPAAPRPLDTLVDGVRSGGHEVVSRELGTPQPLPPELEVVAYRVLQEMLTNAVKHGTRDEPVFVERHWPDGAFAGELRIEVRNTVARDDGVDGGRVGGGGTSGDHGQGLDGMHHRLRTAGGRLDVRRREQDEGVTFTVTAWLPVSNR